MSNQRSAKNYVGIKLIIVKAEDGSLLAIYLVTCLSFLSCLYSFLALDFIFHLRDMPSVLSQAAAVQGLVQMSNFLEAQTKEMSKRKYECTIFFSVGTSTNIILPNIFEPPIPILYEYLKWMIP